MSAAAAAIIAACADRGLDLSATGQVGWYNEAVAPSHRLPDHGDPGSLVILIGNTRRYWPGFVQALATQPALRADCDPLDRHVETVVRSAIDASPDVAAAVRWVHRGEPEHISFQTLAEVTGLAWRSPASLSIHPKYGPWIALRAAIVLTEPGPIRRPVLIRHCHACPTGCAAALHQTLGLAASARWQDWLALRDACPLGSQYRYSADQIQYHYTGSRVRLEAAVLRRRDTRA